MAVGPAGGETATPRGLPGGPRGNMSTPDGRGRMTAPTRTPQQTTPATDRRGSRYARVAHRIATDRCVILDGATGSELIDVVGTRPEVDEHLWGVDRDPRRARPGAGAAPPLRRGRLRRRHDEHLGARHRGARRRRAAARPRGPRPLDGRRAPRRATRPHRDRRRRSRGRGRRRVQHQRRGRYAGRPRDDPAARAGLRGRPARPDPARDAVARARLDLPDDREPARDRASRCGSASAAAATVSAASTASIGADPRAMRSDGPRAASRSSASGRS